MQGTHVESGISNKAYPEIFDTRAMLPQPRKKKPGQLPDELIRKYFEDVSSPVMYIITFISPLNAYYAV